MGSPRAVDQHRSMENACQNAETRSLHSAASPGGLMGIDGESSCGWVNVDEVPVEEESSTVKGISVARKRWRPSPTASRQAA